MSLHALIATMNSKSFCSHLTVKLNVRNAVVRILSGNSRFLPRRRFPVNRRAVHVNRPAASADHRVNNGPVGLQGELMKSVFLILIIVLFFLRKMTIRQSCY